MAFLNKNQQRNPKTATRGSIVNTYYRSAAKTGEASPFTRKTRGRSYKHFLVSILDVVVVIVVLLGLAYTLLIRPDAAVSVNDTSYHQLSDYKLATQKQLQQLKNRNKVTFNEPSVEAGLKQQFPEISDVAVELPLFSEWPKVAIKVAQPSFLLRSRGSDYVINSSGIAVAKSSALPDIKNLETINDQSDFFVSPGSRVISADAVAFINTVIAECHHAKVSIASLTLPQLAQELDLRTTDQTYYVKFYLGGDALTETGQFLAARHNFMQSGQTPSQYLDVRISGKIFYK